MNPNVTRFSTGSMGLVVLKVQTRIWGGALHSLGDMGKLAGFFLRISFEPYSSILCHAAALFCLPLTGIHASFHP